jgi:hypothetical protein
MTRRHFLIWFFLTSPLVGATSSAAVIQRGSTVRGQLYRLDSRGRSYVAIGVPVQLFHSSFGKSVMVYTNSAGMYYFFNIVPGSYELRIQVSKAQMRRIMIQVPRQPITDIPPQRIS